MCVSSSSASASSLFPSADAPSILRRRGFSFFCSPSFLLNNLRYRNPTSNIHLSASLAERNLELSWVSPDQNANNNFGGWAVVESPAQSKKKNGLPSYLIGGIGASLAILLAAIVHLSLSRKGFKLRFGIPLHALYGNLNHTEYSNANQSEKTDSSAVEGSTVLSEEGPDSTTDEISETVASASPENFGRPIIPVAADPTQQEALTVLKKLKIIEDDIQADELCTRREYARWLVRLNSLLERNPRHRIVPVISLCGSLISAFDDVSVEDPDFSSIQSLAEAGLLPSKLSGKSSSSNGSRGEGGICFSPERFISRQDLINWRAQLEYEFMPRTLDQISTTNAAFMDVKEFTADASPELFIDMLAGDKSILKKVFGQSRRFQPNKPSTKAQAAVALTSGRMTEGIHTELLRLEAESSLRKATMEEIRSELLERGDIQKFWDEKLSEEKHRGVEVEKLCSAAFNDLEQEKIVQEQSFAKYLKEKAAIDCQRQLLLSLKEEVDLMSERLACETAIYIEEKRNVQNTLSDVQTNKDKLLDEKSVLEAENEAIRILRSWIEDEARKSRARAKVLEEVAQRWNWDNKTGMS